MSCIGLVLSVKLCISTLYQYNYRYLTIGKTNLNNKIENQILI